MILSFINTNFLYKLAEFDYSNFQIYGVLSQKLILAIYIDVLKNIDKTYTIPIKNEIIDNDTYYLFIPLSFSQNCNSGQYYDPIKYFFFYFVYLFFI